MWSKFKYIQSDFNKKLQMHFSNHLLEFPYGRKKKLVVGKRFALVETCGVLK